MEMTIQQYKARYGTTDDAAPGWDAIDQALQAVYQDQKPLHWGTAIPYSLGGTDPLDGISAYASNQGGTHHLHFVTYGYSALYYDEDSVGGDYSGFGFEMTLRLACPQPVPPEHEFNWVCNFLENLARYVFGSKKYFAPGHWIPANGPIRSESETDIVGLAFAEDPDLPPVATPHGRVEFVQGFGINQAEIDELIAKKRTTSAILDEHRRLNPLLITDLNRRNGEPLA
jgi:hypothetical protein